MAKIIKKGNVTQKIKNPYLHFNKIYNAVTSGKYDIRNLHWQNSTINNPSDSKVGPIDSYVIDTIPEEFVYQSPEVTITHRPYALLKTYYPLDIKYKIGHSILRYPIYGEDGYVEGFRTVNKGFNSKGYNLLTHNCSDSTKEALEKATGIKYNTFLFTTPGDTKDFAKDKLKGKDTDKGVLIPWNRKMSDNLIGFHKHGIKFIGY